MAFDIANRSSLRLNHIIVGQAVDLCDFSSKKVIHEGAVFAGWTAGGAELEAPKVLKNAPADAQMTFTAADGAVITLVKDPNGFGAMFLRATKEVKVKTGEGETATTETHTKEVLRRVTAYASAETISESRAARAPAKAEKAPAEEANVEEASTEEATA